METRINPRGNGACPLCTRENGCIIRRKFSEALTDLRDPLGHGIEIVVYTCPQFKEKM